MSSREQFEEWWQDKFHNGNPPRGGWNLYREGDDYSDEELDGQWAAWKASRQALEIALPILEQQEAKKKVSLREGIEASRKLIAELGGYNFEALRAEQQEKGDGWIYWGGGECPVKGDTVLETRWSDGDTVINRADDMMWAHHAKHCNLIAYRVVQQERERGEEE